MIPLTGAKFPISPAQTLQVSGQVDSGQGGHFPSKKFPPDGGNFEDETTGNILCPRSGHQSKKYLLSVIIAGRSSFFCITTPAKITGADDITGQSEISVRAHLHPEYCVLK